MFPFEGKYILEHNENFYEHLIAVGIEKEKATAANEAKPVFDLSIDGNNITAKTVTKNYTVTSHLIIGEEVEEPSCCSGKLLKSYVSMEGDTLTVLSRSTSQTITKRIYEFSSSGFVVTISNSNSGVPVAKRIYKRI